METYDKSLTPSTTVQREVAAMLLEREAQLVELSSMFPAVTPADLVGTIEVKMN